MLNVQNNANGTIMLIPEDFIHTFHKKILKYALVKKDPNFIGLLHNTQDSFEIKNITFI